MHYITCVIMSWQLHGDNMDIYVRVCMIISQLYFTVHIQSWIYPCGIVVITRSPMLWTFKPKVHSTCLPVRNHKDIRKNRMGWKMIQIFLAINTQFFSLRLVFSPNESHDSWLEGITIGLAAHELISSPVPQCQLLCLLC